MHIHHFFSMYIITLGDPSYIFNADYCTMCWILWKPTNYHPQATSRHLKAKQTSWNGLPATSVSSPLLLSKSSISPRKISRGFWRQSPSRSSCCWESCLSAAGAWRPTCTHCMGLPWQPRSRWGLCLGWVENCKLHNVNTYYVSQRSPKALRFF